MTYVLTIHVFYADGLCLMAPCAIHVALKKLINLCYYSIAFGIDIYFNALKSYCIAFTPKLYKLNLPPLQINSFPISYTGLCFRDLSQSRL